MIGIDKHLAASTVPNRIPWPPLILCGSIAIGLALGHFSPIGLPGGTPRRYFGCVLAILALSLDVWSMIVMARHRANILPHRAATALVTTGPFAVSRNPIYLGNAMLTTALSLITGNTWLLLVIPAEVALFTRLAINREEAHLQIMFEGDFERYRRRTRRWL